MDNKKIWENIPLVKIVNKDWCSTPWRRISPALDVATREAYLHTDSNVRVHEQGSTRGKIYFHMEKYGPSVESEQSCLSGWKIVLFDESYPHFMQGKIKSFKLYSDNQPVELPHEVSMALQKAGTLEEFNKIIKQRKGLKKKFGLFRTRSM